MNATEKRTYNIWKGMRNRCYSQKNASFKYYGARGIKVDPLWRDSFDDFLNDMGAAPAGRSLEREYNDLGYHLENCRWATPKEQARNKRNTRWVTFRGERLSIATWAERLGMSVSNLGTRIDRWGVEPAMTTRLIKPGESRSSI